MSANRTLILTTDGDLFHLRKQVQPDPQQPAR